VAARPGRVRPRRRGEHAVVDRRPDRSAPPEDAGPPGTRPGAEVAGGFELLKTLGRLYVQRTQANPTYQVVAGAVGLLVFLNVVNQLILFAAALAATATTGQVTRPGRRPPHDPPAMTGVQDQGLAETTTGSSGTR